METIIYELGMILPHLIVFLIVMLVFYIITIILSMKKIDKKSIGMYGLLMNLNNMEVFKLSLLIVFYISILEAVILVYSSYYSLLFIILPIIVFEIINKSYFKILFDIVEFAFIFLILVFKNIFFTYFTEVTYLWYVIVLYLILCMFVFLFATYIIIDNINGLLKKNSLKNSVK